MCAWLLAQWGVLSSATRYFALQGSRRTYCAGGALWHHWPEAGIERIPGPDSMGLCRQVANHTVHTQQCAHCVPPALRPSHCADARNCKRPGAETSDRGPSDEAGRTRALSLSGQQPFPPGYSLPRTHRRPDALHALACLDMLDSHTQAHRYCNKRRDIAMPASRLRTVSRMTNSSSGNNSKYKYNSSFLPIVHKNRVYTGRCLPTQCPC